MSEAASDSAKIDLLSRMIEDDRAGRLLSLEEYASALPGADEFIARTYLQLVESRGSDAPNESAAETGDTRVGPYRLERELGRGGQGAVWLARDERLDRDVALKLVRRVPGADFPRRLEREALVGAKWSHPALCPVLDVGADDTHAWVAMRFVDGVELGAWSSSERDWRETCRILAALARGLDEAHRAGVVHRDVKPANIIVTDGDAPVLVDFGVATLDDAAPLTLTGDAVGTPAYMAPEQLDDRVGAIDARTDVWSLGVTLYECLSGRRPFDGPTREGIVRSILESRAPAITATVPSLPRALDVIVETALAREPARRYASAAALAEDLERLVDGRPILAVRPSLGARFSSWVRRNRALATSLGLLATVLVAGLVTSLLLLGKTQRALDEKSELLGEVSGLFSEVTRLADRDVTGTLLEEEPTLWPAHPHMEDALATWLMRADAILEREDEHRAARDEFERRIDERPEDEATEAVERDVDLALGVRRFDDGTGRWLLGLVDRHLADLVELRAKRDDVASRLEAARALEEATIDSWKTKWDEAAASVAAHEAFDGLRLDPQLGLVPLGADPDSGLQEFAVYGTGDVPTRDAETGALDIGSGSAMVMVLVPGGTAGCGADKPTEDRPDGSPFVDALALYQEGPHHECELEAFFIGKHEVTQGQWERHTGERPSTHSASRTMDTAKVTDELVPLLPVETISWNDATRFADQWGLLLPTETQWEYAARAGTDTRWFSGNDQESLIGYANIADGTARAAVGPQGKGYDTFLEDGWIGSSPVGSYRANAWGLHDVVGNVDELCAGTMEDWHHVLPVGPHGEIPDAIQINAAVRGGTFGTTAFGSRSTARIPQKKDVRRSSTGIRLVRLVVSRDR